MNLFSIYAPSYWAAGLPVIPLAPQQKNPIPLDWSAYSDHLPNEATQETWLASYPTSNIGLVLGPQSNIMVVDVDTDDVQAQEVIRSVLPWTPWERRGHKGFVLAYKYNGLRTFRIKDKNRSSFVEVLSNKTQVVIPPSIHPDTRMPYMATTNLLEVHQNLPVLPTDVEATLRDALERAGFNLSSAGYSRITEFVSAGARDNAMISHAGILARAITRGERNLVEAFGEMQQWCDTFVERVVGDEVDVQKGKASIIAFLTRDVLGQRRASLPTGWDKDVTDDQKLAWGLNFGPEQEQWSFMRLRDYAQTQFEGLGADDPQRIAVVKYVLERLARSSGSVSTLEETALLQWMSVSSRTNLTTAVMKKELKTLRRGEMLGEDHTEVAQAVIRDIEGTGDFKYHTGRFWQWKGSEWQILLEPDILRRIAEDYGDFPSARKYGDHQGIVRVMQTLVADDLRTDPEPGINFANGYVDSNLMVRPHDQKYGCTYTLPYPYRPDISDTCFRFQQFLRDCWGSDPDFDDKVAALQEAMAATIFGVAPDYSRAIVLYGNAGTGKTELLNIVTGLLPEDSCSNVAPHEWGDTFKPAEMRDKLLNICGELHETKMIEGAIFKGIVEGSEMHGQLKHKPLFRFRPICAQWFATNHPPRSRDGTEGFNRRWLILSFTHPVERDNVVVNLGTKILAEERESIAAWAVQGIARLKAQNGYTLPASHVQLIGEVANANNSVRWFLSVGGQVVFGKGSMTEMDLYDLYHRYLLLNGSGLKAVQVREFRNRMRELAPQLGVTIEVGAQDKVVYHNVRVAK